MDWRAELRQRKDGDLDTLANDYVINQFANYFPVATGISSANSWHLDCGILFFRVVSKLLQARFKRSVSDSRAGGRTVTSLSDHMEERQVRIGTRYET